MKALLRKAHKRIKDSRAFSVSEALVALIILLLVTEIVAAGIPAAGRAYDNVVVASNAEVLLSTSMSALRNELSTARDITVSPDGDSVVFYNEAYGSMSKIYLDEDGTIMLNKYYHGTDSQEGDLIGAAAPTATEYKAKPLVSKKTSGDKIYVTYTKIDPLNVNDGIITFKGLRVLRTKDGSTTKAARTEYSIKVLTVKDSRIPK